MVKEQRSNFFGFGFAILVLLIFLPLLYLDQCQPRQRRTIALEKCVDREDPTACAQSIKEHHKACFRVSIARSGGRFSGDNVSQEAYEQCARLTPEGDAAFRREAYKRSEESRNLENMIK
ncbi:MAG: hypothetical protein H0U74_00375 [Bradymonadaceae bacterium]|nr:hypothetical protein [Lujinxingiaceae bacterium]